MALSMDEQRMLAEIERHLAAEEPELASNLARLRKPGRASLFRSTRARVVGSLFTVVVVAMVSLMVYALLPFRSGGRTTGHQPVTTSSTNSGPGQAKIGLAPGTGTQSSGTQSDGSKISGAKSGSAQASTATRPSGQASSANPGSSAGAPSASAAYADEHGQGSG
jgi:flagellar basal body L-ring protein FlgH